jgi:hypothetical protein
VECLGRFSAVGAASVDGRLIAPPALTGESATAWDSEETTILIKKKYY